MDKDIKLSALNKKEALRYLGYRDSNIDKNILKIINECEQRIFDIAKPRYVYKVFRFKETPEGIAFDNTNLVLRGNSIKEHLKGCELAVCMAVTISSDIDTAARVYGVTDMARALIFDSLASVAVEQVCDEVENLIKGEYPEFYQTFRYGIGYGDLPINQQEDFLRVLNATKLIGLSVSGESCMLIPAKSVTAVLGLKRTPVDNKKRGCTTCNIREKCKFRETGGHCDGN